MACDLIVPLGSGSRDGDMELRLMLRSMDVHAANLGCVVVVSARLPSWLSGVVHVRMDDPRSDDKDANIAAKLVRACRREGASPRAVWTCDDHFALAPFDMASMPAWSTEWPEDDPLDSTRWQRRRMATRTRLRTLLGREPRFHDLHCPQPVLTARLPRILDGIGMGEPPHGLLVNSSWLAPAVAAGLLEDGGPARKTHIDMAASAEIVGRTLEGMTFVSCDDAGWFGGLRREMLCRFPRPSRWEID